MQVSSYLITGSMQIEAIDPERAIEVYRNDNQRVWIDIQASLKESIHEWLDTLGLTALSRRLCLEARNHSGFYPLREDLFLVIPVLPEEQTPQEMDHLAFLIREKLLVTFRQKRIPSLENLAKMLISEAWLPEDNVEGLISTILINLSQDLLKRNNILRNSVITMEGRMDSEPESIRRDDILDLRTEFLTLGIMVSDQLPNIDTLACTEKPFFKPSESRDYLKCTLADLRSLEGTLGWMDGRINALRSSFDMLGQEKTNQKLNTLTILGAIFNPATLLAGIWGMNFAVMPELKYPYSYPMALSLMLLIGWGMLMFFRKNSWLD